MDGSTTKYLFTDECGDIQRIKYTQRKCLCGGNCYADKLYVEDWTDKGGFHELDIESKEVKYFMVQMLETLMTET